MPRQHGHLFTCPLCPQHEWNGPVRAEPSHDLADAPRLPLGASATRPRRHTEATARAVRLGRYLCDAILAKGETMLTRRARSHTPVNS